MIKGTKRGQSQQSTGATQTTARHNPLRELRDAHVVRREALGFIRQAVGAAAKVLARGRGVEGPAGRRLTRSLARALAELQDGGGVAASMDLIGLGPVA